MPCESHSNRSRNSGCKAQGMLVGGRTAWGNKLALVQDMLA